MPTASRLNTCLLVTLGWILLCPVLTQAADKPNIIFIFVDDQGYYDLSCYGATEVKTPRIDAMAQEGTRFTDYYAAAPICSPSRAGLLTGCYPRRVGNEIWVPVGAGIGAVIASGLVTRDELFLQTKYTFQRGQDHRLPYDPNAPIATQVEQSFTNSLEHLDTDWIDSYLLHGPTHAAGLTDADWEAWQAMETIHQNGQARLLGVSNISLEQLQSLCEGARVPPSFVQNRCYAIRSWDRAIREFCSTQRITYQGFSLLTANRQALSSSRLAEMATHHGCTIAELIFGFALQVGMIPLTGTTNSDHMQGDLRVFDLNLQPDEIS